MGFPDVVSLKEANEFISGIPLESRVVARYYSSPHLELFLDGLLTNVTKKGFTITVYGQSDPAQLNGSIFPLKTPNPMTFTYKDLVVVNNAKPKIRITMIWPKKPTTTTKSAINGSNTTAINTTKNTENAKGGRRKTYKRKSKKQSKKTRTRK
jgi:hypothetical protein